MSGREQSGLSGLAGPAGATHLVGMVVAVDGTSGSGKSSTCRGVADRLGMSYLDTGAMFRAVTWWMLSQGIDVHDSAAVARRCAEPVLVSGTDPAGPTITVDGQDVSVAIRADEINAAVSPVSTVAEVRARLLEMQRAIITAHTAGGGIVVEGRDIGSVVWPQAQVKVYLTADPGARAARRALEVGASDVGATEASLRERDRIDSGRATAPLVMADGAAQLDTTSYTLDEVIGVLVGLVESAVESAGESSGETGP